MRGLLGQGDFGSWQSAPSNVSAAYRLPAQIASFISPADFLDAGEQYT
jgi:hypothetical protein